MKLGPDSIEAQLLRLPPRDRARLAELLLASLEEGPPDEGADEAWAAEAERRYRELAAGEVAGIPAADVYATVEAALRRQRGERA
jgi:putative addiction module component (TIGR02574 family)